MVGKLTVFFGSIMAIPIVAQMPTTTTAGELGKASGQMVLAIVLVFVSGALVQVFRMAQKDRDKDRDKWEKRDEKFTELMVKNAEAMTRQADSNEQVATAIIKCKKE